jgi:hypothetical protein
MNKGDIYIPVVISVLPCSGVFFCIPVKVNITRIIRSESLKKKQA